jgi:acetamidase/formamidase/AraC-like DNA-binding protein
MRPELTAKIPAQAPADKWRVAMGEGGMLTRFYGNDYPGDLREEAWLVFLSKLGMTEVRDVADLASRPDSSCSGLIRTGGQGMTLSRLSATGRTLAQKVRGGLAPLLIMPLDETIEIERDGERMILRESQLGLVPADPTSVLHFGGNKRSILLKLPDALLQGRRSGNTGITAPRAFRAEAMSGVLARLIETAAYELERFKPVDWSALEQSVTDLFFSLPRTPTADGSHQIASTGLLGRVTQTIEVHLGDSGLTPAMIAELELISVRYLHRLFENEGETFSHYLRERRLLRARTLLCSAEDLQVSIANIAYSCGFDDPANFNRQFKKRFGQPPGGFRTRVTEQLKNQPTDVENRGWPLSALDQPRSGKSCDISSDKHSDPERNAVQHSGGRHHLEVNARNVHWGYLSRSLEPVLSIDSGDQVVIETLTQHATDAHALMIDGDPAAEEVFFWDGERKAVNRRGAGPIDASVYGRGAGEGFGVHICTGPIAVEGAEPGDVIEVRIDDITPRPSNAPGYEGRCFGSNVSAWWGYQYAELLYEPKPREIVTIFEVHPDVESGGHAEILYSYKWEPQCDPFGAVHRTYDYPGVPVSPETVTLKPAPSPAVRVPLRPHFGVIALAPREDGLIDSVPPAYFGGNIDNWRLGKGASIYLPVSVSGGLLSVGDPHAAQGDGELSGTAIECSMTGTFTIRLHKKGTDLLDINYPLIETPDSWVLTGLSYPDYLAEFGAKGLSEVYAQSSLDLAMRDAFRKARRFMMARWKLSEDEVVALISASVDFGVTQVVDGNWGVHAIIPKSMFAGERS